MKYILAKVSKPYRNPFILAKGLNPVRSYSAQVIVGTPTNNHVILSFTGVVFANQAVRAHIRRHAAIQGYGLLPIKFVRGSR